MGTSLSTASVNIRRSVGLGAIALAVKIACGTVAYADLPSGGNVISGAGSIGQNGNTLTVTQQTARMGVEWESFNVGAGQRVQFSQPGADSVALNRVVGSDASHIMGSLDANGKVFLVNPNGVLFGKDAQVNTGGLIASTLGISNEDFAAGRFRFTKGDKAGSVVNDGNLTSGSVVLIAPTIENSGSINTHQGNTTLAAGEAVTVSVMNNGLITAQVDRATLNASIRNSGRIIANGGSISLQAGTADAVLDSLINSDGLLQAQSIEARDGRIFLGGGAGGTVFVGGTVDASGYTAGQKGGEITALG
ncbi:MAG TPA: filamentous hemagglutinin N-terminal domain-containing protein, partial [Steroidobacter sp.]|nr:filamentous hemagglutinin N-terminal domain-containing protein [Steroidobacter sp.]